MSRLRALWLAVTAAPFLDRITLAGIAFTLAFATFAFGAIEAWSQVVLTIIIWLLCLLTLLRGLFGQLSANRPWLVVLPLGLLAVLMAGQLVTLPSGVVGSLSPGLGEFYAANVPSQDMPKSLPLSIAPHETWHSLRLVLLAMALLVVVLSLVRTKAHFEQLLAVVFGIGCLEALLCIAQIISGTKKLYWCIDAGREGMLNAGSFVNHSHFSQFANLGIGAGVALLLLQSQSDQSDDSTSWSSRRSPEDWLRRYGLVLLGLVVSVLAVCLSLSRGGILSLSIGATIAGALLAVRRRSSPQSWLLAMVPAGVFIGLVFFGFDLVYDRVATLEDVANYKDRWQLTVASLVAGADFWVAGAGAGTYHLLFPAYDTTTSTSVAQYADNDYAQAFVEWGLAGLTLIAVTWGVVIWYFRKCLQRRGTASVAACGLLIGLIAVSVHAFSDFGQRLPAVFLTTTTTLGLLAALSKLPSHRQRLQPPMPPERQPHHRLLFGLAIAASVALGAWSVYDAARLYQAETWWSVAQTREDRLRSADWQGDDTDYGELLVAAENSLAWHGTHLERRFWLQFYRWMSLIRDGNGPLATTGTPRDWEPIVAQLAGELADIRRQYPTYQPPFLLEGQLVDWLGQPAAARELLLRSVELARNDPRARLVLARWAKLTGDAELSKATLVEVVALDRSTYSIAAAMLVDELNDVPLAVELAGDQTDRLHSLLTVVRRRPELADLSQQIGQELTSRLEADAASGAASASQFASLAQQAALRGDATGAIDLYRNALASDYANVAWRLALAEQLMADAQHDAAMREVRICLRLSPANKQALAMAEALALLVEP